MGTPKLMVVVLGAAGIVVAAVTVLAFQTWWALALALVAHAIGSVVVVTYALRRAGQASKPDPVTEARLEEEQTERGARARQMARD